MPRPVTDPNDPIFYRSMTHEERKDFKRLRKEAKKAQRMLTITKWLWVLATFAAFIALCQYALAHKQPEVFGEGMGPIKTRVIQTSSITDFESGFIPDILNPEGV